MAVTYSLAPIPKWIIINNEGTTAGGAKLYTYRSLNKVQEKIVYQDAGGTIPYTNPIIFDANGVRGPFYWAVDSADPADTYYLEAYDSADNLLWTVDDYAPTGGGGGSDVTTYIPLQNYIANNVFIEHIDDTANPLGVTNLVIAPSNHKGFTPALVNPVIGLFGAVGPDMRFVKNNTNATDQITFPLFALATAPLTGDVTPVNYVRYQCTNSPAAETYKSFQFPITQKIKNLANQDMTFTIWSAVTASSVTLTVYVRQYFGSGTGTSTEVRTSVGTIALTTTWTKYNIALTIPTVAGKSIGTPGLQTDDDALYIQLEMPLGAPCDVLFTKPSLYLGSINPDQDFETYDSIDTITQSPRTGDIKAGYLFSAPASWVPMNDGSIGNVGSAASIRANQDTFQLYKTIWDAVSNTWAPVSTGRGATAQADFVANKTLTLPKALGRVLMGQNAVFGTNLTFTAVAATDLITVSSTATLPTGTPVLVSNTGGALPVPLVANTPYYVINVSPTTLKLAREVNEAQSNIPIDLTTAGTGTNTLLSALGASFGEGRHTQTVAELAVHSHPPLGGTGFDIAVPGTGSGNFVAGTQNTAAGTTGATGSSTPFNIMQPSSFMNYYIKL